VKVAVTGGTGFIGRQLILKLMERGDSVRILSRRPLSETGISGAHICYGDLSDREARLEDFVDGADVLYHCAGVINDTRRMHSVHVQGTERLLAAVRGRIGKWVQLSSVGAYGPVSSGTVTEEWPESPVGEYERTKTESDRLVRAVSNEGAFPAVLLRPSIVYGLNMRNRSLFQLIRMIDRGLFFFIGPLGANANYIHVANIVEALICCGMQQRANGRAYIVSDHRSLEEFVGMIAMVLGRPVPRHRLPLPLAHFFARLERWIPGFPLTESRVEALSNRAVYSCSRIQDELGYIHPISMEQGIRQMVEIVKG
jgi:nucleoside-diphosphate-sugar epimerase